MVFIINPLASSLLSTHILSFTNAPEVMATALGTTIGHCGNSKQHKKPKRPDMRSAISREISLSNSAFHNQPNPLLGMHYMLDQSAEFNNFSHKMHSNAHRLYPLLLQSEANLIVLHTTGHDFTLPTCNPEWYETPLALFVQLHVRIWLDMYLFLTII